MLDEDLINLFKGLREALYESVKRNLAEGLLLSGGLDTSIIAYLASKLIKPKAFTVALKDAFAPDVYYAKLMASFLGLNHFIYYFDGKELYEAISKVIEVMKSFDPMEVRNSIVVYVGLKRAKGEGLSSVMTGDGSDELFAGYSFLFKLKKEDLSLELQRLWSFMEFSSICLSKALGISVKLPYLDEEFKEFAIGIEPSLKVKEEKGRIWGKWILRKAFEGLLPEEIIWRDKAPIEVGSGTSTLTNIFNSMISDLEFEEKRKEYFEQDKVSIRDKEQLFYYEIYRSKIGVPKPRGLRGKICPKCNSDVAERASYCRTCGAYPI